MTLSLRRSTLPWLGSSGSILRSFPSKSRHPERSEEHTSELPSLMRTSSAVFCFKKKKKTNSFPFYIIPPSVNLHSYLLFECNINVYTLHHSLKHEHVSTHTFHIHHYLNTSIIIRLTTEVLYKSKLITVSL